MNMHAIKFMHMHMTSKGWHFTHRVGEWSYFSRWANGQEASIRWNHNTGKMERNYWHNYNGLRLGA